MIQLLWNDITGIDTSRWDARSGHGATRHSDIKIIGISIMLLALAGCAGAQVTDLASVNTGSPAPTEILVAVDAQPASQEGQVSASQEVATKLRSDLIERLTKARITAEPYVPGTVHPGAAVLQVAVTDADKGNKLERFVIGFGVGKAKLQVSAHLVKTDAPGATSEVAFNTYSDSGLKPGLVLPGAIALSTGRVIGLAIGGAIDVGANIHGGLDKPARNTATAITGQLKKYYASAGWQWPAAI